MDVAAWLRGLGLEQYAPAFRDNDVDAEVLPGLTADDLINIGVKSVGHRRKLLDAIAAFRTDPSSPREGRVGAKAERRQLTVMFSDLVGRPHSRRSSIPRIYARSSPNTIVL
jgi:hypothetical protein